MPKIIIEKIQDKKTYGKEDKGEKIVRETKTRQGT